MKIHEARASSSIRAATRADLTELPAGTPTFLFTDVEGSTRLWEADADRMRRALARHDQLVTAAVATHAGHVFKHTGDGLCAVFGSPADALRAAVDAQIALETAQWIDEPRLRSRMGIHTGQAEPVGGDYLGAPLNRCARIMSAGHGGQILCSATTAAIAPQTGEAGLRDLGIYRLRDLSEPQHLHQVVHAGLAADFPPLRVLDLHRHNLPVPRTSFIGREHEIADLAVALRSSRIVTVVGVGGSGKTRLALQAAADLVDAYPDGVYIAELASISDPAELAPRVADAIGVPLASGQAMQASPSAMLVRYLQDKHLFVIFDNCEHMVDGCAALIDTILTAADRVTVVATSREPLGISGERILRIPSLGLATDGTSVEAVAGSEAGLLFADRAALARPDFTITPNNVQDVAQICRRLDGIPLAIELAAARLRHLSVHQIAERLDDRFRILTGGGRTALPRQQTLQATLEWSHDLLSGEERVLFRRCSVFVGSFSLAAAEGICAAEDLHSRDVLDLLGRLVDRSLLLLEDQDGAESRYRFLETMRHFAQQKLLDANETTPIRDRHRDWYATNTAANQVYDALYGYVPLAPDLTANMRAALEWAMATGVDDSSYRLMAAVAGSWMELGLLDEASELLLRVLDRPWSAAVATERAWVMTAVAFYANMRNEFAVGLDFAEAALAFVEKHGPIELLPHVFGALAISSSVTRSVADGERWMERAATTAGELSLTKVASLTWMQLAGLRMGHDPEAARAAAEEALTMHQGQPSNERGRVLGTVAFARLVCGDVGGTSDAIEVMDRVLIGQSLDAWADIEGICPRAAALAAIGRADEARRELQVGLQEVSRLAVPLAGTAYLVGFGAVDAFSGDPERALVLLAAARRRFDEERAWRVPVVGGLYVQSVARARSLVPMDVARDARAAGLELTSDAAFSLATTT